jgi:hypothetical protein
MIPLHGFLRGDTVGLLILGEEDDTVNDLAEKLASAARVRVATRGPLTVLYRGVVLDPQATVKEVGLSALERFDVEDAT